MNHTKIDNVSETMRVVFETTENNMIKVVNQNITTPLAQVDKVKRSLQRVIKQSNELILKALDNTEEYMQVELERLKKEQLRKSNQMLAYALLSYRQGHNEVKRLEKIMPLKDAIAKQTQVGIQKGMRVAYKNGRTVGYKEYMEMNVRTTLQQEIGELQLKTGKAAGIVFYITNHFADCADDHKEYQGKIYYDNRYKTMGYDKEQIKRIEGIIRMKKMKSVQEVRDGKPYMTTRPNCRHTFTPISIEQAGGKASDLVRDLKLSTGSYKDDNYKALQKQRYNERQIRFYKNRMELNEETYKTYPSDILKQQIESDRRHVSAWQKRQRGLIKSNGNLSRDYRRETQKAVLNDLGVRYGN